MTRRLFILLMLFPSMAAGANRCYETYTDDKGRKHKRPISCQANDDGTSPPAPKKAKKS